MHTAARESVLLEDVSISRPRLLEPRAFEGYGKPQGDPKYSVLLLLDDKQAAGVRERAARIAETAFGDASLGGALVRDGNRIADEAAEKGKNLEFLRGRFQMNAASGVQRPPRVVGTEVYIDAEGNTRWKPLDAEPGSGSRANVSLVLSSWSFGGKQGVTAYLQGVQVTQPFESSAEDMFGAAQAPEDPF